MNQEQTNDAGQEAMETVVGVFGTISSILDQSQMMGEVQSALLIRLGMAVMSMQVKLGLLGEAHELAEAFSLAASVIRANAHNEGEEE